MACPLPLLSFSIFPLECVFEGHNEKGPHGEQKGQQVSAREVGVRVQMGHQGASWVTLNKSLSGFCSPQPSKEAFGVDFRALK